MARYTGAVCRHCRREGLKLFLKGERCYTDKCAIERRNYPPGEHGQAGTLSQLLERRLDNIVYRLGFATSRAEARQLVRHGHFRVNEKKVDVPSYLVKRGDIVSVRERSRKVARIQDALALAQRRGVPDWLDVQPGGANDKHGHRPSGREAATAAAHPAAEARILCLSLWLIFASRLARGGLGAATHAVPKAYVDRDFGRGNDSILPNGDGRTAGA